MREDVLLRRQKVKKDELKFIEDISDNKHRIKGAIINIEPKIGYNNYVTAFGNPLKENTLVVGDDEHNLKVCFKGGDNIVTKRTIFEGVDVIPYFNYTTQCVIHKKEKPADVPQYMINVIFQNNITNNINITQDFNQKLQLSASETDDFMSRFYRKGGIMPLATARKNSEWMPKYKADLTTQVLHRCKSCGNKAHKGCCADYSTKNRLKTVMIIGWSEK